MYKNKERKKFMEKKYMEEHKEEQRLYQLQWRKNNKQKIALRMKKYRVINREEILEKAKKYYQNNKNRNKDLCDCGNEKDKRSKKCFECQSKLQSIPENNGNWLGGVSNLPYAFEFNGILKESIRYRDSYICQNCGMTEEEHLISLGYNLVIHHIDYNKQNCEEDNLITLCNQCNIRANFNRSYWQEFYTNKVEA